MKDTALIVVNGDVVMDVDVDDVVSAHFVREATATCVLAKRRAWGEVERKAGRAPKGMRYIGLSADEGTVAFLSGGKEDEAKKRLKLHRSALNNNGEMVIRTDLTDVGAYVLDGAETLRALRETPHLKSVRLDLVPHFVEEQFRGTTKGGVAAYIVKDDKYCVAVDSAKPALLETLQGHRVRVSSPEREAAEQIRQRRRPVRGDRGQIHHRSGMRGRRAVHL